VRESPFPGTLCRVLRALAIASLASVAGAVGASGAASGPVALAKTFHDSTGEHADGPDVTTVGVSSDGGAITFHVVMPATPVVTEDMRIRIWLDADDDRSTGLFDGSDHFLLVDPARLQPDEAFLYRCSGTTCLDVSPPPTYAYADGHATFTVPATSLGLRRIERILFAVWVYAGIRAAGWDYSDARLEFAPDEGMWVFDARPLRVVGFGSTPRRPRAGEPLALSLQVLGTESGALLDRGNVSCSLRIGTASAPARTARFVGRRARCVFAVPVGTRGQRYRATIGVAARGSAVTRALSGRVG